jgi:hypothetical protein
MAVPPTNTTDNTDRLRQKIEAATFRFSPKDLKYIEERLSSTFAESIKKASNASGTFDGISSKFIEGAKKAAAIQEVSAERVRAAQEALNNAATRQQRRILEDEIREAQREIRESDNQLKKEQTALDHQLKMQEDALAHRLKMESLEQDRQIKKQEAAQNRQLRKAQAVFERQLEQQEESFKTFMDLKVRFATDKAGLGKDIAEGISGALSKGLSGVSSSDLIGGLGGMLSKGGGLIEGAGLAAGGAEAGGLAAAATSLGPIVAGLGGVVAALGAVAAIFDMAYDQTKKFNMALTEGAGSADFFANSVGVMSGSLKDLRKAGNLLALQIRMDTEEVMKYTTTLNSSGITYKEFAGFAGEGASQQQAFMDVTRTAIVASKALGIEATDAAAFMDRSMRDLGTTALPEIQDAFSMINDAAARSGMSVKSFFTAINETTSGMALHNFRLEDTIELMQTMVDVLGEDVAKQEARLKGTFRQMGYQERIRTVMTTGVGKTSRIVGAEARTLMGTLPDEVGAQIRTALGGTAETPVEELVQKLGTMNEEQYRQLVFGLRQSNQQAAAMQLDNMRDLARGAARPGDVLAQADAIGQLSKSGELAMELAQASAVLGDQGISSMEGLDRAAYEQITGRSGENFEIMKRLDRALRGGFDDLQARLKAGTATAEEQKFAGMGYEEAIAAGFGGQQVEEGLRSGFSSMERMTEQLLSETQSIFTTLKNSVVFLLEGIYGMIELIAYYMPGASELRTAIEEQSKTMTEIQKLSEKTTADQTRLNELTRKEASGIGLSGAEKAEMESLRNTVSGDLTQLAGLQAKLDTYATISDPTTATGVAPVAQAAGELGAGGGAPAAARLATAQTQAETDAANAEWWQSMENTALNAAGGAALGSMIMPGAGTGLGAWLGGLGLLGDLSSYAPEVGVQGDVAAADIRKESAQRANDALDTISENTGVSTEATEENRQTLISLLSATEEDSRDTTELLGDIADRMKEQARGTAIKDLIAGGYQPQVQEYLTTGKIDALSGINDPLVKDALQALGVTQEPAVRDFVYQSDGNRGRITPINKADELYGAMPGGAISRAGAGGTVNIVVNGGDTAKVYAVVKQALQDSGITPPAGGR